MHKNVNVLNVTELYTYGEGIVGRGIYKSYYKGHKDKIKGGGQTWGREMGLAGVGWRDGQKMQTIVTE